MVDFGESNTTTHAPWRTQSPRLASEQVSSNLRTSFGPASIMDFGLKSNADMDTVCRWEPETSCSTASDTWWSSTCHTAFRSSPPTASLCSSRPSFVARVKRELQQFHSTADHRSRSSGNVTEFDSCPEIVQKSAGISWQGKLFIVTIYCTTEWLTRFKIQQQKLTSEVHLKSLCTVQDVVTIMLGTTPVFGSIAVAWYFRWQIFAIISAFYPQWDGKMSISCLSEK